jgi:hypothetical protein
MNLRHAAALALVGWYLMAPLDVAVFNHKTWPPTPKWNTTAPLREWRRVHFYEDESHCAAGRTELIQYWTAQKCDAPVARWTRAAMYAETCRREITALQYSVCVNGDDTRLKEK